MARRFFADSFYFIALLSERDEAHERAIAFSEQLSCPLLTTDAVLLEVADALSSPADRQRAAANIRSFWEHAAVQVIPLDRNLLRRALAFYASRRDKDWGLTDCISFVVMQEEGISEALTGDEHFEQAGFRILFPQS